MTHAQRLAGFVRRASYDTISPESRDQLKIRVLDSLACAFGALPGEPIRRIQAQLHEFGGEPLCTLIGGGKSSPDRATFYNGALVRYLDYMDNFPAHGETCHPSDNFGAILAASEYSNATGPEFLTALAIAYQVQCRLTEEAPVTEKGFDHTVQLAFSVACGVAKALGLDEAETANAIGAAGTGCNGLWVTRTGGVSQWKGIASAHAAFSACHAAFLAARGITAPADVFDGTKGFKHTFGTDFDIDWDKEDLEIVKRTSVKKYNAEVHSQTSIDALLTLQRIYEFESFEIKEIEAVVFDTAYDIIGGGEAGDRHRVANKEQADHSLPYILAVAAIDKQVEPAQYLPDRIMQADVQSLMRKVKVRRQSLAEKAAAPANTYNQRYPIEFPAHIIVRLEDGRILETEKAEYDGFWSRPQTWEAAVQKFERLAGVELSAADCRHICETVKHLEDTNVASLTSLLGQSQSDGIILKAA